MGDSNRDQDLEELKIAADTRKFEIGLFWSRSLFFWGFTSVAATIYGAAYAKGPRELQFTAACIGIICSLVWTLTNRGSKFWQNVWEQKTSEASFKVFNRDVFAKIATDRHYWWDLHYSVSKLATAFTDFTLVVWICLAAKAFGGPAFVPQDSMMLVALTGTILFASYILIACRPSKSKSQ